MLAVGVPLIRYIPIDALRVIVGALLLVLGLSWLRKAILRASGHKDPHDEDKIFAETVAEITAEEEELAAAQTAGGGGRAKGAKGRDGVGFAVAFKGVFLEGTEVVLIVISLGAAQHRLGLAALAAAGGGRPRRHRRPRRGAPAERGPREHHQDAGGRHVDQLRCVLGR